MDARLRTDLERVKAFFEQSIGCVVGCGCWERGWDAPDALRSTIEAWDPASADGVTIDDVREALLHSFAELADEDVPEAARILELSLDDAAQYRDFFQAAHDALAVRRD